MALVYPEYNILPMNRKLTRNFSIGEVFRSDKAVELSLCNYPSSPSDYNSIIEKAGILASEVLQPVRDWFGRVVDISSWYRSPLVNAAVGGSNSSQHLTGAAVDFVIRGIPVDEVFDWIRQSPLMFDQLIRETRGKSEWVHCGIAAEPRRMVMVSPRASWFQNA